MNIWDIGHHFHEASHGIVNFDYTGAPRFYSEGITDFIRFVARGNPAVDKGASIHLLSTDRDFLDAKKTWDEGYGKGARFLLWLTQHYDTSGAEYRLVRKLLQKVADADIFTDVFGASYRRLFRAYKANPEVNPHC